MLNELLLVERDVRKVFEGMTPLHRDVKFCRCDRIPMLLVRLDTNGNVKSLRPVPIDVTAWTIRNGQHNSFPFVRPQSPLLSVPLDEERRPRALSKRNDGRREALLALANEMALNTVGSRMWPGAEFLKRLRERLDQLVVIRGTDADVVPATIERFLVACDPRAGGDPLRLLRRVTEQIAATLRETAQDDWLEVAGALLLGKLNKGKWERHGAFLFEADGFDRPIVHADLPKRVSAALSQRGVAGVCGLTGEQTTLVTDSFSQPNLRVLGQTFLFAKNKDIPAAYRYGRVAAEAMPVGQDTERRLAAALRTLTADERHGKTWREIPGEALKANDLLLAFVEAVPDAPVVGTLAEDDSVEDYSEEGLDAVSAAFGSVAVFEKRTERLIDAVRGKVTGDFRQTPVHVAVFRGVDQANRKIVCARTPLVTVGGLYRAVTTWAMGERNYPPWLTLPVLRNGDRKPGPMPPPHVAPLGVVGLSKQIFLRNGERPAGKKKEQVGLLAAEALDLFLASPSSSISVQLRVNRVLRLVLARRTTLLIGVPHVQHAPRCWKYRHDRTRKLDHREALRTVTMLGLLLYKLGRTKEDYMNDTAFRLGQFLAAADVVHAGYCADLRGGDVPPSLLGNQVLTMAQSAPVRALAILSRRWKPYDGWAKKAARKRDRSDKLVQSKDEVEVQRGWDIRNAVQHARRMGPLAAELGVSLPRCAVNDAFRAELLLGYIAGLPKTPKEDGGGADDTNDNASISREEE